MAHVNDTKKYINDQGIEVPRVSSILKSLNKDALVHWANYLGFKRISYTKELNRTAIVGTAAHDTIDEILTNMFHRYGAFMYGIFESKSVMEYDNCMKSFSKWYEKNWWLKDNLLFIDLELVGDSFGGTLDYVGKSPYNKDNAVIIDWKTSKMMTLTHFLQLAAYIRLWEKHYPTLILDGVLIVRMNKKDGKIAEEKFISREDMELFIELFEHLLEVTILSEKAKIDYKLK